MSLSDTQIKALKPTDKQYKKADEKGLYLLITPNGSKLWRFKYYHQGKEKTLALGTYPDVSLKSARIKRYEARTLVAAGVDPAASRKAEKVAEKLATLNTFKAIAESWLAYTKAINTPATEAQKLRRLERYVYPVIGNMPASEVKTNDIKAILKPIVTKGYTTVARAVRAEVSAIYEHAILDDDIPVDYNPDQNERLVPEHSTTHNHALVEPKEVGQLLRDIDAYPGTLIVKSALQVCAYLFQRPGEIRSMKWDEINWDASDWKYFVSKTKVQHIVPLPVQVINILQTLHSITGRYTYVFMNNWMKDKPISTTALRSALVVLGYGDKHSPHGFRAMARTLLDEQLHYRVDWVECQLAHAVIDPNGRAYNRTTYLTERKKMMQSYADYLDSLKNRK